jgi:hypothetical protein
VVAAVTIESDPPNADVLLDGAIVGRTPVLVPRPASGEREVVVRLRGYEDSRVMVMPTTGATLPVTLTRVVSHGGHTSMSTSMDTTPMEVTPPTTTTTESMTTMRSSSEVVDPWDM